MLAWTLKEISREELAFMEGFLSDVEKVEMAAGLLSQILGAFQQTKWLEDCVGR